MVCLKTFSRIVHKIVNHSPLALRLYAFNMFLTIIRWLIGTLIPPPAKHLVGFKSSTVRATRMNHGALLLFSHTLITTKIFCSFHLWRQLRQAYRIHFFVSPKCIMSIPSHLGHISNSHVVIVLSQLSQHL